MADMITAISALVAALSVLGGVTAWKREFIGKRRIELAEQVLAMFYEAEDAIRDLRNPVSFESESKSRTRALHESAEESTLLDRAYVVFERYKKREEFFAQLRAIRYRFMATFGASAGQPFEGLSKILNDIFSAAHMLGRHYWPRQGRVQMTPDEFQKHLTEMYAHEAVFWYTAEANDPVIPRVRAATKAIEALASQAATPVQTRWLW